MNKKSLALSLFLIVLIVVLVNVLASRYYFRIDFTEEHRYTLSDLTKSVLLEVSDPITISAYFSDDLPPDYIQVRDDLRAMLTEYQSYSHYNVAFDMVDPAGDAGVKAKAEKLGVLPIPAETRERDQIVIKELYLSVLVQMGERHEVIPVVESGESIEYLLTRAIVKLQTTGRPAIGFIQGHGEPPLAAIPQALMELMVHYDIHPVGLDTLRPHEFKALIMLAPRDSIPVEHLQKLDEYLSEGGRLFLGFRRVEADFSRAEGYEIHKGLGGMLATKGILLRSFFVLDQNCGFIHVLQPQAPGAEPIRTQVSFPYFPVVTDFPVHPITRSLGSVVFQLASPILFAGDTAVRFMPLARTSTRSGIQQVPLQFSAQRKWTDEDFPSGPVVVAAAFEGPLGGEQPARLVVVTNGEFPVNGVGDQAVELLPDNVFLLTNSIDWLADEEGLTSLRTKAPANRFLKPLSDGSRIFVKWLNFLLPVMLVLLYGLYRMFRAHRKRNSSFNPSYAGKKK